MAAMGRSGPGATNAAAMLSITTASACELAERSSRPGGGEREGERRHGDQVQVRVVCDASSAMRRW